MHEVESKPVWRAPRLQSFGSLAGVTRAGAGTVREVLSPTGANGCKKDTPKNKMKYPC